ncbi:hypothetical protein VTN49DRAFT_1226 [Thermomyces lanuginosus]|uniref:uncharacterized protein n=1 Tax=Thermomyces lanuginosus TaxID=5541 RepID=UPI0037423293
MPTTDIDFKDYLEVSRLSFEWAESYDTKDWDRLRRILTSTVTIDYSEIGLQRWEAMDSEEYVAMVSSPDFLGAETLKTQHFLGQSWYERVSATEVTGHHQIRAAHQAYTGPDLTEVKVKGHCHAVIEHYYRKVDGVWKLAGLKPIVRWNEYQFEEVFKAVQQKINA